MKTIEWIVDNPVGKVMGYPQTIGSGPFFEK